MNPAKRLAGTRAMIIAEYGVEIMKEV
jgi:hypothetical protein